MIKSIILLSYGFILIFFVFKTFAQDIGFPEQEKHKMKMNANGREPIYIPNRCGENEFLYPGDKSDDWICDCRPGYIYYPTTRGCYLAYQKGPCRQHQYLVLVDRKPIPECHLNLCRDGEIKLMGKCYTFGSLGPCKYPEFSEVLGINATTLKPACIKQSDLPSLNDRFSSDEVIITSTTTQSPPVSAILISSEMPLCAEGTKRFINQTCPISTNQILLKK